MDWRQPSCLIAALVPAFSRPIRIVWLRLQGNQWNPDQLLKMAGMSAALPGKLGRPTTDRHGCGQLHAAPRPAVLCSGCGYYVRRQLRRPLLSQRSRGCVVFSVTRRALKTGRRAGFVALAAKRSSDDGKDSLSHENGNVLGSRASVESLQKACFSPDHSFPSCCQCLHFAAVLGAGS